MGIVSVIIGWLQYHLGLTDDPASSTGSLHAKTKDIKNALAILGNSANVRTDNTIMGWLASPIKSIQRGTISFTVSDTSKTATISSVNTNKAEIRLLGMSNAYTWSGNSGTQLPFGGISARIALTNATTVTATRGTALDSSLIVSYEVIEHY